MSKPKSSQSPVASRTMGNTTREGHYYVQSLTEQIFVVRKCQSAEGKPGSDDSIVRSFTMRHDAYSYMSSLNDNPDRQDNSLA